MQTPSLFDQHPARVVKESLTTERRNVPTQRASLDAQRSTGKAAHLFSVVTAALYGRGTLGLTLEELHGRVLRQRPDTPLSSLTQPMMDSRLAGFAVKTVRSREGSSGKHNRIFVHRAHWQESDGEDLVNDTDSNRKNLRRLLSNGYPIYRDEVVAAYSDWLESDTAPDAAH